MITRPRRQVVINIFKVGVERVPVGHGANATPDLRHISVQERFCDVVLTTIVLDGTKTMTFTVEFDEFNVAARSRNCLSELTTLRNINNWVNSSVKNQ